MKTAIAGCCILSPVGGTAASAESTTLICKIKPGVIVEDSPTTIDLNPEQGTITYHAGAHHCDGCGGAAPAHTIGPFPASFGDQEITFSYPAVPDANWVINRLTGDLTSAKWAEAWNCQAGHKQF